MEKVIKSFNIYKRFVGKWKRYWENGGGVGSEGGGGEVCRIKSFEGCV